MAPSNYTPAYGGKPNVPNPGQSAASAISSNMGNLANIYQMAGGINAFNTQQQLNDLMAKIPNYQQLVMQNSGNIMSGLQGQLPQDVIRQMIQQMSERGIRSGLAPGAGNTNAAYIRALGTNSLALQQQAHTNLQQTIQNVPKAQPYDISQMLISPDAWQSAAMAQSIYNSAPDPAAAAEAARRAVMSGIGGGGGGLAPRVRVPGGSLGSGMSMLGGQPGQTYWTSGYGPFSDPNQMAANWTAWRNSLPGVGTTSGNLGPNNPYYSNMYQGSGIQPSGPGLSYDLPAYYQPQTNLFGGGGYSGQFNDVNWGVGYDVPNPNAGTGGWLGDFGSNNLPSFLQPDYYDVSFNPNVGSYLGNYFDDSSDVGSGGGYFDFGIGG